MTRPAPLWPGWWRDELAARPGRWRQALAITASSTVALFTALLLQIATFPAPLLGFKASLPSIVCTWRNLLGRLAVIVAAGLAAVHVTGVLVQVPWLLVPVFFATVSALTYLAPVEQSPVRGYCVALTVAATVYTGIFAPAAIGDTALRLTGGFAIGLIVATLIAQLRRVDQPHELLSRSLADTFVRAETTLRAAGVRYRAAPVAQPDAPPAPPPVSMVQHLHLFDLVRQEHRAPELERAFVALMTAAERVELFVSLADALARQPIGASTSPHIAYRRMLDAELGALLDAVDFALPRFAQAAQQPHCVVSSDLARAHQAAGWPDFPALVGALHARQQALYDSGQLGAVGVEESANLNSFVQALDGLADVLHLPPEALEYAAPEPRPPGPRLRPFDPYAAQFALKVGFASGIALIVGVTSHVRELETIVLVPLLLVQGSYGATLRKAGLRMAGVIAGGLLAALTIVLLMPNTTNVVVWLTAFFAVVLPLAFISVGTPRFAYFGLQSAITFMIVMVADGPVVDIHKALWRFFGALLGTAIVLGVFQIVLPDYAGRQIVRRFADLLRLLLTIVPDLGRPLLPTTQTQPRNDRIITGLADILRLAEEARFEGGESGIDRAAAVDAAGQLRRIAHRWALIRRGRRPPRPPLPPALHAGIAGLESALRQHLGQSLEMLEARHHRSRTGSPVHRAASSAAAAVAARPRQDLAGPLQQLEAAVAAARRDVLHTWPTEAASALLAEHGHLCRLVTLVPALDASLQRMALPEGDRGLRGYEADYTDHRIRVIGQSA